MDVRRTSLSAGFALKELLGKSREVSAITGKVFPVVVDKASLPYVVYRRKKIGETPVKGDSYDHALYELICCAKEMDGATRLAEAVRSALDGYSGEAGGLRISRIMLVDAEDGWESDAYMVRLDFMVRC